jgi:hypothetical protein
MTRRKGEATGKVNERDYPNMVELPVPSGGFRETSVGIVAFHRERRIEIRHGRGRQDEGRFFVRYCFANPTVADAFRDQFGGQRLIYGAPLKQS